METINEAVDAYTRKYQKIQEEKALQTKKNSDANPPDTATESPLACFYCKKTPLLCGKDTYWQICCDNFQHCDENPCAPSAPTPVEAISNWNAIVREHSDQDDIQSENEKGETPVGMNLIGIDELAKKLNVPKSWIYGKTRTGEIPHYKVGKYVRFDEEEVMDWIRRRFKTRQHYE